MARLDHYALRVLIVMRQLNFNGCISYKFQAEFEIFFNDEKTDKALCIALDRREDQFRSLLFIVLT